MLCSAACPFRSDVSNWQKCNASQRWSVWRCEKVLYWWPKCVPSYQFWSGIKASDSWSMSGSLSEKQDHWSQGWLNRQRHWRPPFENHMVFSHGTSNQKPHSEARGWEGGPCRMYRQQPRMMSSSSSEPSFIFQVSSFMLKANTHTPFDINRVCACMCFCILAALEVRDVVMWHDHVTQWNIEVLMREGPCLNLVVAWEWSQQQEIRGSSHDSDTRATATGWETDLGSAHTWRGKLQGNVDLW